MKKMKLATIGLTGAIAITTAVTAFAAPTRNDFENQEFGMAPAIEEGTLPTSLDRLPEDETLTLPELSELDDRITPPEKPAMGDEADMPERPELPEGEKGAYIPKLKPDSKPDDEDRIPPEFEGIEGIEELGRPELPENFGENDRPEMFGQTGEPMDAQNFQDKAPFDRDNQFGMPGESEGGQNFGGEMPF